MSEMTNRDMLIALMTEMKDIKEDVKEIKDYTGRINGGLRKTQNDVVAIQTNCGNCTEQLGNLRTRMSIFTTIATVGGGILGYIGSYFK
ncbi:MAG: hypothetical protein JW765_09780 [Deltaproteobacteria bacterium]|nr:hypothetical protein [Candidatus Zymogenaceae bacterium]